MGLFVDLVGSSAGNDSLLDIGGGPGIAGEFAELHGLFGSVTIVNLEPPGMHGVDGRIRIVVGDGCALPVASASFDWVFSNAVIEHVGGWQRQKLFAEEVRRVARKGYFIATPNKYFPIEPHTLLPFYQFLPPGIQRRLVRFSPGYLEGYEQIDLLTRSQLQDLFREADTRVTGFPLVGNSLVAFYAVR